MFGISLETHHKQELRGDGTVHTASGTILEKQKTTVGPKVKVMSETPPPWKRRNLLPVSELGR